ncbi:FxsA family protein [Parvularcula sp. ZS-1/3]|uniref:FxsA family protein n=1 Tax=Parvularcula mediterranea TaxID=2732508 RepID=A0A7Y3RL91_9PROT|nr:FxsA family protein [Parvularcula mediterranea]NNU15596.1 FxsA family protein [Parvularcula mediterranea]
MALIFFVALVLMPIIEITLLIQGAMAFGIIPVIGLTIGTAALGTFLIKRQGLSTMNQLRADMAAGQPPVASVVDGAALLVAAPLLLTPGFVTDGIGFLLLVPPLRHAAARYALRRLKRAQENGKVIIINR